MPTGLMTYSDVVSVFSGETQGPAGSRFTDVAGEWYDRHVSDIAQRWLDQLWIAADIEDAMRLAVDA